MTTTRHALDFYRTSEKLTNVLLENVDIQGRIFEPCAGDGAIADLFPNCFTNDIDPNHETDYNIDATVPEAWSLLQRFDWVVTNPPFSDASLILDNAWENTNIGVAFLLRLSYLEPAKARREWLLKTEDNLRYILPVNPRPKFRLDKKGSDSATVAWFVWLKDFSWDRLGISPPIKFIVGWN